MSMRALNILHICDDLGWEGSRMHGPTRLLGWTLPRFDAARFNVSLASLRKRDRPGELLESMGVTVSYLHRSAFDPATLTAILKIIDHRAIDLLHLHGRGATTFGRAAAAMRRLPAVLHEHAGLIGTSWFQRVTDRALAPYTDVALADSKHTAAFVIEARFIPAHKVKVVGVGTSDEDRGSQQLAAEAGVTGGGDIGAYVRKLERLYAVLHGVPRRHGETLERDLSFLTSDQPS
jgi:hypothetical protein